MKIKLMVNDFFQKDRRIIIMDARTKQTMISLINVQMFKFYFLARHKHKIEDANTFDLILRRDLCFGTSQTKTRTRSIEYFVKGFDTHLNCFAHTLKNEQHTLKNNSNKSKAETKIKSKLVFLARHMNHTNTNTFDWNCLTHWIWHNLQKLNQLEFWNQKVEINTKTHHILRIT